MADGYIDLSPIVRQISGLSSDINAVGREVNYLRSDVETKMSVLKDDLETLKRGFVHMMEENRRQAALQRAITEIIRVRQELERDFGNYKQVRNTMLGILEANDLKLVRQTTIATCTEELMLATPRYWLAPVLIALSAWIADNKPLAERALKEALRRDEEKTCLTFALICRRNKRTKACFEWLSRYFAKQKANDMKESIIAYIDAYTNGVFGEDRDNLCEEYLENWMQELQSKNANFEEQQVAYWKNVYQTYCQDTSSTYPKLAQCASADFPRMNDYAMRINAAPEIINFFADILSTEVDQATLVTAIDNELIKLVKNYDKDEAPLREEEEYLTDIKKFEGDEKRANALRDLRRASRTDRKVDLAERLSQTIVSNRKEDVSAKKTAIRFMQGYIKTAFGEFLEEKAPDYPQEITVNTHGWSGKTAGGSNKEELLSSYSNHIEDARKTQLSKVKNTKVIIFGVFAAISLILMIVGYAVGASAHNAMTALGVIFMLALIAFVVLLIVFLMKNKKLKAQINNAHDTMLADGKTDIELTIQQYQAMNNLVFNFNAADCSSVLLLDTKASEEAAVSEDTVITEE